MPRCSSCVRPAHCIVSATLPYTPSFWTPPVAAARKGSSPTCSLVAESHNSSCLCAAGCKLYRGFENPVTLRSRPATPTPIFIPCCGLEKAMCNSIRSDPAVKIPPPLNNHSPGHSRYSHSAFRSLSKNGVESATQERGCDLGRDYQHQERLVNDDATPTPLLTSLGSCPWPSPWPVHPPACPSN